MRREHVVGHAVRNYVPFITQNVHRSRKLSLIPLRREDEMTRESFSRTSCVDNYFMPLGKQKVFA